VRLRVESDDREEGRRGLEDVVTGEVFGSGTDGNGGTGEDLESDLGPSTLERLEVDTTVDERLSEVATAGLEGVDTNGEGTGSVGGGEELESLSGKGESASSENRRRKGRENAPLQR
jgi:hypothetical protein